ncbi:MAG: hypothetical protein CSA33_05430 [Desulfobulbus propionicus]|nr:MAG: hypothetical protein CSA33_05430 [Desulfobulbus propionicus]
MNDSKNDFWFPKMKIGIGWGLPITWQGWLVLLSYFLLTLMGLFVFSSSPSSLHVLLFLGYFAILTLIFILIVWKKGEKIDV